MEDFASRLDVMRESVARDLDPTNLERATVLAGLVQLLDAGFFRVGSERYAAQHRTFGLTTLLRSHVTVRRSGVIVFDYTAKHGKRRVERASDERVAELVVRLKRRRSDVHPRLFSSRDLGRWSAVRASDLNAYLQTASGTAVTAKDFRTWNGTVLAATLLAHAKVPASRRDRERVATGVLREVADALGNTLAVARGSYVDPRVVDAWGRGDT
ncbi:MAG: DNA topoisomerase IB, partial [Solirubrobacteraceae bacterium]|nr:DNA topoisomerase IB [Solirubrobacteraceae bacterium]